MVVGSGVGNLLLRNSNHELCRISMAFENFDSKGAERKRDSLFEIIEELYSLDWIGLKRLLTFMGNYIKVNSWHSETCL